MRRNDGRWPVTTDYKLCIGEIFCDQERQLCPKLGSLSHTNHRHRPQDYQLLFSDQLPEQLISATGIEYDQRPA